MKIRNLARSTLSGFTLFIWINVMAGHTNVDNFDFQPNDAYHQTRRITANLLFSPIPRVDIGAELLWGEWTNKDGGSGDAPKLQIASTYIFSSPCRPPK